MAGSLALFCIEDLWDCDDDALGRPLFLFAEDSTLCRSVPPIPPRGRQQLHLSLLIWNSLDYYGVMKETCPSILENLTISPYCSGMIVKLSHLSFSLVKPMEAIELF